MVILVDEQVMRRQTSLNGFTSRLIAALPGWLFLTGGLVLLGLIVLSPEWRANVVLRERLELMRMQVSHLDRQVANYTAYHEALVDVDSQVLEQLAFTQLHLKPVGKEILLPQLSAWHAVQQTDDIALASAGGGKDVILQMNDLVEIPAGIDQWLYRPLPEAIQISTLLPATETRLTRLSRGWYKLLLVGFCGLCLIGGIYWGEMKPEK